MSGITIPDVLVVAEDVVAGKPAYVPVFWCPTIFQPHIWLM